MVVSVNGKEVRADARDPDTSPDADSLTLVLDLEGHPYLRPGANNTIEVRAFNAEGYLSSRSFEASYSAPEEGSDPPTLWAVVAGVSNYEGELIDLRYAEQDAANMSEAIGLGARRLFGADRVHVKLLTTAVGSGVRDSPSKANLARAFAEIAAEAQSTDILVVYLAGHGVTYGGTEGDFYYLTREASSESLEDPDVRAHRAVSSGELTKWIQAIAVTKQVLILDTCGAGRVIEQLREGRYVSSSRERALERLKDRMGLFVLAGSAADAVSYEASRYGQGFLMWDSTASTQGR